MQSMFFANNKKILFLAATCKAKNWCISPHDSKGVIILFMFGIKTIKKYD